MKYAFLMIKPHAVEARDVGAIISVVESHGFTLRTAIAYSFRSGATLYEQHKNKPYFDRLLESVNGPVVACVFEYPLDNAIKVMRTIAGATDPTKADPKTLRHRFGVRLPHNAVHTSDSPAELMREVQLFFSVPELPHGLQKSINNLRRR